MQCIKCGEYSGSCDFCRTCREILGNATAIVSQNKKKIMKLVLMNKYIKDRFDKFILYTENIIKYGSVILEYRSNKENEINKRLETKIKRIAGKKTYKK